MSREDYEHESRPVGRCPLSLHARSAAGRLQTVTLGRYPELPLKGARELAATTRQSPRSGEDVSAAKRARRIPAETSEASPTLGEILAEHQSAFADRRTSWRPPGPRSTRGNARRCIEAVFTRLLDRPVGAIGSAELANAMRGYVPRRRTKDQKDTSNG